MNDDPNRAAPLSTDLGKYIDAAARQLGNDFQADPARFFRPHPARLFDRWDDPIRTAIDLGHADRELQLQVTTSMGYTVHRLIIPLDKDIRYQQAQAALPQVQQDLYTAKVNARMAQAWGLPDSNRQVATTLQDLHDTLLRLAVSPPCLPGLGRYIPPDPVYHPPEPEPLFHLNRTFAAIYHPSGTMVMPWDPDPSPVRAVPQIARHGGARYRVGETVLWQGGTVTIERRFRMLWKWRYTIDGPAIYCEVDEEELAPA